MRSNKTNSEIGSHHWFMTLAGRISRTSHAIAHHLLSLERIGEYGKCIEDDIKELMDGYNYIGSGSKIDLRKLRDKINAILETETEDSLNEWLDTKRTAS